jgi:hypothetical protein
LKKNFTLQYVRSFDPEALHLEPSASLKLPSGIKGSFDHVIFSSALLVEFSQAEFVFDVYLRSEKRLDWAMKLTCVFFESFYRLYLAELDGKRFLVGYQYRRFTPKFLVNAWGSKKISQLDDATGLLYHLADPQIRTLADQHAMYADFIRKENLIDVEVTYSDHLNESEESQPDIECRPQDDISDQVFDSLIDQSPNLLTDDENEVYSRQPR